MLITGINHKKSKDKVILSTEISTQLYKKDLWFSIDSEYENMLATNHDFALIGLLIPAMALGEGIEVHGKCSAELLWNIDSLQSLLQRAIPWLKTIQVQTDNNQESTVASVSDAKGKGVLTALSGGIDSFAAIARHTRQNTPASLRITHLGFFNVRASGPYWTYFQEHLDSRLSHLADQLNLPLIKVNSNLDEFYSDKPLGMGETYQFRYAAAAHAINNEFGTYVRASTVNLYEILFAKPAKEPKDCEGIITPLLSSETLKVVTSEPGMSRIEKTRLVSEYSLSHDFLNVCNNFLYVSNRMKSEASINCSRCDKCLRTMITLDMLGKLEQYSHVFNIQDYQRDKKRYFAKTLVSRDHHKSEVLQFARKSSYPIPISSYFLIYFMFIEILRSWGFTRILRAHLKRPIKEALRPTAR